MSDDLVKRLRNGCSCNIDSTPCMAEDECRAAFEAANYMEEAANRIEEADRAIANLQREYDKRGDSIEVLEQSVVRLEREVRWWEEDSATRIEALERENRLYRIMVEDCDRQRKTQYDRAETLLSERDEAWRRASNAEEHWGHCEVALATMTAEQTRLHIQCDGLMQSAMNNGQALIIAEAALAAMTAERDEAQHAHNHMVQMWGVSDRARMVEVDRAKTAEARLAKCEARLSKAVEALRVLIDHTHNCEKELTEDLHRADFCGESLPLTNARATLAELGEENV